MDDTTFRTSDTALAAYFIVSGIVLIELDTSTEDAEYVFEKPSNGVIGNLIIAWESGEAEGNCKAFYKTYKQFVTQIKKANHG